MLNKKKIFCASLLSSIMLSGGGVLGPTLTLAESELEPLLKSQNEPSSEDIMIKRVTTHVKFINNINWDEKENAEKLSLALNIYEFDNDKNILSIDVECILSRFSIYYNILNSDADLKVNFTKKLLEYLSKKELLQNYSIKKVILGKIAESDNFGKSKFKKAITKTKPNFTIIALSKADVAILETTIDTKLTCCGLFKLGKPKEDPLFEQDSKQNSVDLILKEILSKK
ncbi:hypothetical protein Q0N71_31800 [Bacillus thuringiensis]|uniref:hypothetical protein n=1 Tax=Bacillus thuringiensis TaxID=1428 RepID=UPI00345918D5